MLEQYELDFLQELARVFYEWLDMKGVDLDEVDDLYSLIIQDFLGLDTIDLEDIFEQRYKRLLSYYFYENYTESKLPIFLAFICHLVLETDMSLFFPRLELTGRYYGNWAIGYPRDKEFGDLIANRIQYSYGKEGLADFYFNAYLDIDDVDVAQFVEMNKRDNETNLKESENDEAKSLLQMLLGASAATVLLSTVARFAERAFRVWVASNVGTQSMLSVGYLPGSLKFYGFCMEKPKRCPSDEFDFVPMYREDIPEYLDDIYDRVPSFANLFVPFMSTTDPTLLALASQGKSDKIWRVLQEFFWLLTQPYVDRGAKDSAWQHFLGRHELLPQIKVCDDNKIVIELGEGDYELDYDMWLLTRQCLDIIQNNDIRVHPANVPILKKLIEETR